METNSRMYFEFKNYKRFVGQTIILDFYSRQQRYGYSLSNF